MTQGLTSAHPHWSGALHRPCIVVDHAAGDSLPPVLVHGARGILGQAFPKRGVLKEPLDG